MTHSPQGTPVPVAKNHQEVVDALDGVAAEFSAACKAASEHAKSQRTELMSQCGAIGHLFGESRGIQFVMNGRVCVYCGASEPKEAAHG